MKTRTVAAALSLVAVLATVTPVDATELPSVSTWSHTTVSVAAGNPVVRFAPDGTPRVVFQAADGLWFARPSATGWTRTLIVAASAWDPADLELDAAGKAHVVYDLGDAGLYYATDRWGAWRRYHVTLGECDDHPDLAVDPEGEVDIVFHRYTLIEEWGCDRPASLMRATNRRGYWQTFALTHPPASGADVFPSIGRDPSGGLHIAFRRSYSTSKGIYYLTNASGRWETRALTSGSGDRDPRLVVARDGAIDVGFVGESPSPGGFGLASNRTGTWVTKRDVVKAAIPSERLRAAIDRAGEVHIAWCDGRLRWATERDGAWVTEQVSSYCAQAALAVDAKDRPWLARAFELRSPFGRLELVSQGATWSRRSLGTIPAAGWPSIVGDPAGHLHATWSVGGGLPLRYATNVTGSWGVRSVPGTGGDQGPVLAADAAGKAHIATWVAGPTGASTGISELTNASGTWIRTTVSAKDEVAAAIAVGPDGSPWVLGESSDTGLRLYHRVGDTWKQVSLPTWAAASRNGRLAIDPSGKVHLAMFRYAPTAGIAYATNATGTWSSRTFSEARFAHRSALTVDGSGRAHLVYAVEDRVRYATNASGSWVVRYPSDEILSPDVTQGHLAVGLDGAGGPWIGYPTSTGYLVLHRSGGTWFGEVVRLASAEIALTVAGDRPALLRVPDRSVPVELLERRP